MVDARSYKRYRESTFLLGHGEFETEPDDEGNGCQRLSRVWRLNYGSKISLHSRIILVHETSSTNLNVQMESICSQIPDAARRTASNVESNASFQSI